MGQVYTKKDKVKNRKKIRLTGLIISALAFLFGLYIFFPIISWELYTKRVFANNNYASPIPQNTVISENYLSGIIQSTADSLSGKSSNWLPSANAQEQTSTETFNDKISSYTISIPKININNAVVSTTNTRVDENLVHFPGTAVPGNKGTAAIFGHSTLPQLYDPENYRTIFAKIHEVKIKDKIIATVNNTKYNYSIIDISVIDAEDTSYFTQNFDNSYITIITCTPPGTIWKRLIIKARLDQ